jgi:hypothetical protein
MTSVPTDNDGYRTRDKSLHGLLVALGITSIITAVVIVFAYAASDGTVFGITTNLTPLQNKPVDSTPSLTSIQEQQNQRVVTEEQQQKIDQKGQEPVASKVGSENDFVIEKPKNTETEKVKVPPSSDQSLQYVNMPAPAPLDDGKSINDASTASTPSDNNRQEDRLNDNNGKADVNGSNNSTIPSSPSRPATPDPSELTKEEKKALKEKQELEKKLLKEQEEQEKKLQKLLAKAPDSLCSSGVGGIVNDNIEVNGACQIDATVKGNIKLDAPDDSVNFDGGSLDGNIEAKDSDEVNVGSGTSINGNVKSENTTDTNIGAAVVRGNIEVKDGNLKVLSGAEIFGNIKHEGSGICVVATGAIIHGNMEGCPTP